MFISSAALKFFAGLVPGLDVVWSKREEVVLMLSENLGCWEDHLMARIGRYGGPTLPAVYVEDTPIITVPEST